MIGETMQIITGGLLEASPHSVGKTLKVDKEYLNRTSFSLHIQPKSDFRLFVPEDVNPGCVRNMKRKYIPQLKERWTNGITY